MTKKNPFSVPENYLPVSYLLVDVTLSDFNYDKIDELQKSLKLNAFQTTQYIPLGFYKAIQYNQKNKK